MESIAVDILKTRRQYFIEKVKAPLVKALNNIANSNSKLGLLISLILVVRHISKYPEPTKENTKESSTHVYIDMWDEFERYNKVKPPTFKAIRRIFLCENEHDGAYRNRILWFVKQMSEKYQSGELEPLKSWYPVPFGAWTEPLVVERWGEISQEILSDIEIGIVGGEMEMRTKAGTVTAGFFEIRSGSCPDCGILFDDSIKKPRGSERYCPKCDKYNLGNIKTKGEIKAKEEVK